MLTIPVFNFQNKKLKICWFTAKKIRRKAQWHSPDAVEIIHLFTFPGIVFSVYIR
jgi:hypothetical protein